MSEGGAEGDAQDRPRWIRRLLMWLGVLSAVLAVSVGIKENWCKLFACEDNCQKSLAPYVSPSMGGGHNHEEICGPQRKTYEAQNPQCNIGMNVSEASDKDALGHVTYVYSCYYSASPK